VMLAPDHQTPLRGRKIAAELKYAGDVAHVRSPPTNSAVERSRPN
jgi:hypothetical protein